MDINGIYPRKKQASILPRRPRRHQYRMYVLFAALLFAGIAFAWFDFLSSSVSFVNKPVPLPTAENPNFLNQVTKCFLPVASLYGYDLRITVGFRSMAQQAQIYNQGRTEDGHIVTEAPPGHSLHNFGYAVDVADIMNGYNINWIRLVAIAAYCHLESGGDGDLPHFEYRDGLTTDQFLAGMRPPTLVLPCAIMAERSATGTPLSLKDLKACNAPKF